MIECIYCKTKGKVSTDEKLTKEISSQHELDYGIEILKCKCGNKWPIVDLDKEIFNITVLDINIRTFKDFLNLLEELKGSFNRLDIKHATLIKDCISRINDWLTSGGKVEDSYVQNMLSKLESM